MLTCQVIERRGEDVVLALRGELAGRSWTDSVRHYLEEHYIDDGVRRIRLDLDSVTFLDNFGVATLVALLREAEGHRKVLVVEGDRGQVRDKLLTTGVRNVLHGGG